jgi:hypothetical protein
VTRNGGRLLTGDVVTLMGVTRNGGRLLTGDVVTLIDFRGDESMRLVRASMVGAAGSIGVETLVAHAVF